MKHIIAYIKPNKLPAITLALHRLPELSGMSFSEVRGFSSDRIPKSGTPIVQDLVDYTPYIRVEVFCSDEQAYEVKWTIHNSAHTGQNGDGKIYVVDGCEAMRIQNGRPCEVAA